jgi:hypothetical protein
MENGEFYQLCNEPGITTEITNIQNSCGWYAYLGQTTFTNRDGTRKVGRLPVKLKDGVAEDFERSTVNKWKTKAAN